MLDDYQVEIPEAIRLKYIERRQTDLEVLKTSLRNRTFEEFKRIGHQIKGNAASFGYQELERIAVALESAAKSEDMLELSHQVTQFEEWIKNKSN